MYAGRIYADFQNLDDENRVRLNTAGTVRDLTDSGLVLDEGSVLDLYTDDANDEGHLDPLFARATVEKGTDGEFVARVNWNAVRSASRVLELFKKRFFDTAIGDVLRALEGQSLIGATLQSLCLLDHLGFLRSGVGTVGDFEQVVDDHLTRLNPAYDSKWLWSVRNGLVHAHGRSKALREGKEQFGVAFTDLQPQLHLVSDGKTRWLNVESFITDVLVAAWDVFDAFKQSPATPLRSLPELLIVGQPDEAADKAYGRMHPWLTSLDDGRPRRDELERDIRQGLELKKSERKSA